METFKYIITSNITVLGFRAANYEKVQSFYMKNLLILVFSKHKMQVADQAALLICIITENIFIFH